MSLTEVMKFQYTIPHVKFLTGNIPTSELIEMYTKQDSLVMEDQRALDRYMALIKPEFHKYSSRFFKRIGLKRISFVKNLIILNVLSTKYEKVHSTTDAETGQYIIDIFNGIENPEYQLSCFHHELFHLIEININGTYWYEDKKWMALNPRNFKYGKGGAYAYINDKWENLEHPQKGFITNYAMLGIEEDRAETFAYMMTGHLKDRLEQYMQEDKILRKKIEYLKIFINELNI